ncbi:MAG: IGHMBP2 family helicase [Candidatus Nanohaloarchaea archaeon]
MSRLVISGLKDEGPGDIVGAVAGETDVSPDALGDIDINSGRAIIETENADELARELDGSRIGHSEVSAAVIDEDTADELHDYISRYRELVELEREEEMRQHEESIKKLSGREREDNGRAILHLRGRDQGEGLGGHRVKFMRNRKGEELPETEISVGDLVMISKKDPLRDDNPTGTVVERTNYSITVSFDQKPADFVYSKDLRMDLYVNDITYQRMIDALESLPEAEGRLQELRDIIIGLEEPGEPSPEDIEEWNNTSLNPSQRAAVEKAVGADDLHLIHGPPGTGKTTTLIEVIEQEVKRGRDVLATADSNTAVDNLLEFLLEQDVDAVRVGHPARVTPALRDHTLDSLIEDREKYQRSQELRDEAFDLKDQQEDLTHPSGRYRRGMSDEQIKELAEKGKGSRGVPADRIEEMAEWLELQEEIDSKFEKAEELEDEAVAEVIDSADVVCSTNSTSGSGLMEGREFDTVVIDEATQATEPSCMIPLTRGEKLVMAGDHRQLPPTVKSEEASELENSLFEKMASRHPGVKDMLKTQYRMHQKIMEFSSSHFYDGKLEADELVADHTLKDLGFEGDGALDPQEPVVFIDTAGEDAGERQRADSTSRENPFEADKAAELAERLIEGGLEEGQVAVISPYEDQVDLIDRKLGREDLEVDTVDGFQGREKEAVIISLVRSNEQNDIGFLKDVRRLNVALTRAKRKLVVIGDSSTLQHETYRSLIDHCRRA